MKRATAYVIAFLATVYVYLRHPLLVRLFRRKLKRWPRPGNPKRYADRLMWRKVFDRDPLQTRISDKLAVKEFVHERVGNRAKTPRTLWAGTRAEDIPAEHLTGNVVVKPNHSFAAHQFVINGVVDRAALVQKARGWLVREHFVEAGEWAYVDISRKLLIEEMVMENGKPVDLDVKVHVYSGRAMYANLIVGRHTAPTAQLMDRAGRNYGGTKVFAAPATPTPIPPKLYQAMDLAEEICADFDFMRCDMYLVGDDIYVGELTVYPAAGHSEWTHPEVRATLDAAWDLRRSWYVSKAMGGFRGLYAWALRTLVAPPTSS